MNKFMSRIKYIKLIDIFSFFPFFLALPCAFFFRFFHKNLWVICEDKNEARDNGYWLFKYICEHHPEIDAVYAINKKSPDAQKVQTLGKTIQYGSFIHWIYYLCAEKNISSQKGGKPNAAVCYVLEISGILKNIRIFLQHGIIQNDCKWLYFEVTRFALFVASTEDEAAYIITQFHYPPDCVKLLGLCRFDNLLHNVRLREKQILIMPTWREWLSRKTSHSYKFDDVNDFINTEYFRTWDRFLKNKNFHQLLAYYNLTVIFYPHRNMQKYLHFFDCVNTRITFANWKEYDIQELLKESIFLITDYSSIAMDFAYMKKPLVYYQFDQKKFREAQYQAGYFSYEEDGFGEVVTNLDALINIVNEYMKTEFKLKNKYNEKINSFYTFTDSKNCERNFNAIYNLKRNDKKS